MENIHPSYDVAILKLRKDKKQFKVTSDVKLKWVQMNSSYTVFRQKLSLKDQKQITAINKSKVE